MNKMIALVDFNEMDGDFKKDASFSVNDERAFVLERLGKARRLSAAEAAEDGETAAEKEPGNAAADPDTAQFALRVPQRAEPQQ